MEGEHKREKKMSSTIFKKLERCLSSSSSSKRKVSPSGCFSVYVGPEKMRFVIKTEFANHHLFRVLLEDAELEYGFTNKGPLLLPCDVDLFVRVLAEIDSDHRNGDSDGYGQPCGPNYGSCSPFSPAGGGARRLGKSGLAAYGCGSYRLQTKPIFLDINQF